MPQETEIAISAELRSMIGKEMGKRTSPRVEAADIRKWAIALYWPETPPRIFWDEAYAQKTPFKGIVAPEDFNPFAWPIDPGQTFMTEEALKEPTKRIGIGWNVLNGGGGHEYLERIRPGDVITAVTVLDEIFIRKGSRWPMIFFIRKSTWTNQKGQVVRITKGTTIRY